MGINHITLMGVIDRGPEFRMTQSGIPTCTFTVAVTRPPRVEGGHDITDYIRVMTWRGVAEKLNESVHKGDMVVLEGRLTTRSYETQDGQKRKTIEIEASAVSPIGERGQMPPIPAGRAPAPASTGSDDREEPPFDDFDDLARAPAQKAPAARSQSAPARPSAPLGRSEPPSPDLDDEIPF